MWPQVEAIGESWRLEASPRGVCAESDFPEGYSGTSLEKKTVAGRRPTA